MVRTANRIAQVLYARSRDLFVGVSACGTRRFSYVFIRLNIRLIRLHTPQDGGIESNTINVEAQRLNRWSTRVLNSNLKRSSSYVVIMIISSLPVSQTIRVQFTKFRWRKSTFRHYVGTHIIVSVSGDLSECRCWLIVTYLYTFATIQQYWGCKTFARA